MTTTTRPAAVAGLFYPDDAASLRAAVREALADVPAAATTAVAPKMLLVPHAGYVYSGAVAAHAYAALAPWAGRIRRVVLLGPTHRVPVRGLAMPTVDRFETPLGPVPLDRGPARRQTRGLRKAARADLGPVPRDRRSREGRERLLHAGHVHALLAGVVVAQTGGR